MPGMSKVGFGIIAGAWDKPIPPILNPTVTVETASYDPGNNYRDMAGYALSQSYCISLGPAQTFPIGSIAGGNTFSDGNHVYGLMHYSSESEQDGGFRLYFDADYTVTAPFTRILVGPTFFELLVSTAAKIVTGAGSYFRWQASSHPQIVPTGWSTGQQQVVEFYDAG